MGFGAGALSNGWSFWKSGFHAGRSERGTMGYSESMLESQTTDVTGQRTVMALVFSHHNPQANSWFAKGDP